MTAKVCCRAQPFGLALNVIIVSVSSAEAIQPVRTDRYTLAHHRSPAAGSNTAGHTNTRPISVHTVEVNRSKIGKGQLSASSVRNGLGEFVPPDVAVPCAVYRFSCTKKP